MIRAMWTAATGMTAQQLNVDTIANNLANVNTNAFKRSRAEFSICCIRSNACREQAPSNVGVFPVGVQVGQASSCHGGKEWVQGNLRQTGNELDVAIDGWDFSRSHDRTARSCIPASGRLNEDNVGNFVTGDGDMLNPVITIPSGALKSTSVRRNRVGPVAGCHASVAGRPDTAHAL